jgi:hypothetical protein
VVDYSGPLARSGSRGRRVATAGRSSFPLALTIVLIDFKANLPYVLWCAAYNVSFLFGYLVLDRLFAPKTPKRRLHHKSPETASAAPADSMTTMEPVAIRAPPLLEAINKNGLALFLIVRLVLRTSRCQTHGHAGERDDGYGEPLDADHVRVGRDGSCHPWRVHVRVLRRCVEAPPSEVVVVIATFSERDNASRRIHLLFFYHYRDCVSYVNSVVST